MVLFCLTRALQELNEAIYTRCKRGAQRAKKFLLGEEKGKKGRRKRRERGQKRVLKGVKRQFEESEDEFLNGGESTAERTKQHFILYQEEIRTNRERKRKRGQECHKVGTRGERRKRKKGASQVEKEKEQMRLSGYICSLWFCEVMCSFRLYQTFKVEKMSH